MKYEITQELLQMILQLIGNAKQIGCSYVEMNGLVQQLQALPKIEEPKKAVAVTPECKEVKK